MRGHDSEKAPLSRLLCFLQVFRRFSAMRRTSTAFQPPEVSRTLHDSCRISLGPSLMPSCVSCAPYRLRGFQLTRYRWAGYGKTPSRRK
jgi:hypothetical protein